MKWFSEAKLSVQDRILFTKRLSFLLSAGISLPQAITIIVKQSRKSIRPVMNMVEHYINEGYSLSRSLEAFAGSFPASMTNIIRAGEKSGLLKESLSEISNTIQQHHILVKKIIGSLIYPCVIVCGTIGLSLFLIFGIFPKVRSLFDGLHIALPLSTRLILWLSDVIHHFGIIILGILVILFLVTFYSIRASTKIRYYKDSLMLKLPLIGSFIQKYILSSSFRMIGIMLKAHIEIGTALDYACYLQSNKIYEQAFKEISRDVMSGKSLSESLHIHARMFPEIVSQLIEVGEASSSLSDSCIFLSEMLDQEIEESLKIMVNLIEPVLMLSMGLVVGFISLSIITPIYEITQNIKH